MEFLFDLQRFAEGDAGNGTMAGSTTAGSAPASGVESQTTATQQTTSAPASGTPSGGDNGGTAQQQPSAETKESIGLVTDPRTGGNRRRTFTGSAAAPGHAAGRKYGGRYYTADTARDGAATAV